MTAMALGVAYLCGFIAWSVAWAMAADGANRRKDKTGRRTAARMVFLSPIWPIMAVLMAGITVVELWKDADWRNG
jgi:hypothetical protein